jgi:tetratricopeptide (TPR) repeat protein
MATGRQAFGGQTTAVVFDAILNRDPVPVQQVNPAVPVDLVHIVTRALEKDRKMRFQTAADMMSELDRLRRDTKGRTAATVPAPAAPATNTHTPGPTRSLRAALAVLGVAVAAAAGYWYWQNTATPAFTERDLVVIADFDNTTGDAVFDDALRQAVSVQLQQSPFVTLLPEQTIQRTLRLMSKTPDEPLSSATAREVCQRAGAKASVEGSIAALGSAYVITLGIYHCESGGVFAQRKAQASSKDDVLTQIGRAVTSLREGLGESLVSIKQYDVPVTTATTASLEALKAYGLAHRMRQTRGDESSITFYQQAIAHDPKFALAYAKLGVVSANIGRTDDARKYTEQAYALRDRVSEYERLYIEWSHATRVANDRGLARQTLEMMVAAYPGDYAARNNLGVLLMQIADFGKALEQYQAAMAIAPGEPLPISNAAYALLFLGRLDDAFVQVDRALALRPDANLAIARWSLARMGGHPRAAEFETVARGMAAPQQLLFADANLAVWDGRLTDYRRIIEQLLAQARASSDTGLSEGIAAGETITMAVVQRGEWIAKAKALMGPDVPPQGVAQIAASLAVIGEIDTVRTWVPRLEAMDPNDPQQTQPALVARALVMTADGRGREGAALIESYLAQNPRSLELHYYLGLLHERAGAIDDALASYRLAAQSANVLGPNPAVMAARLGLGRLLKQKGDDAGANEQFDALLKQWEKADADFYMLKVVKDARPK